MFFEATIIRAETKRIVDWLLADDPPRPTTKTIKTIGFKTRYLSLCIHFAAACVSLHCCKGPFIISTCRGRGPRILKEITWF